MKVPYYIQRCTAFIGIKMADGSMRMAGTVFFVEKNLADPLSKYAVTAKHILEGIKSKGLEHCYIRVNSLEDGAIWHCIELDNWIYHKDINFDIATLPIIFGPEFDVFYYKLSDTVTVHNNHLIGTGDEIFIVGLFKHHHGNRRNIPIIRIGNIAAMRGEKIQTRDHLMDGYLIEARSIGGLSGSPVFVHHGTIFYLLGLIYGHYDTNSNSIDEISEDMSSNVERVNTGIAIVTPVTKLKEHLSNYYNEQPSTTLYIKNSGVSFVTKE